MNDLAQDLVRRMSFGGAVVRVVHEGQPERKQRPRFGRGRAFTPEQTERAETALAWAIRAQLHGRMFTGNVAVLATFYRSNRQRIDADNLMKLVLDAGTRAGAWRDDCQVTLQLAALELDALHPRTELVIAECASTLKRDGNPRRKRST